MKKLSIFVLIPLFFSSCLPLNRMTSPEILSSSERSWIVGVSADAEFENDTRSEFTAIDGAVGLAPVIGYRSGMRANAEWGLTLNTGIVPTLTFDIKHGILERGFDFYLSGDAAIFSGLISGVQYDVLAGNDKFYGAAGLSYYSATLDLSDRNFRLGLGIGTAFDRRTPIGLQCMFTLPIIDASGSEVGENAMLFIGMKLDFTNIKRR